MHTDAIDNFQKALVLKNLHKSYSHQRSWCYDKLMKTNDKLNDLLKAIE